MVRQSRSLAPGTPLKLGAALLTMYWLVDAFLGTDSFERFSKQWWLCFPIAGLLLLSRYIPRLPRTTGYALEVASFYLPLAFVIAGVLGVFRFRYWEVQVDVIAPERIVPVPVSCQPDAVCLTFPDNQRFARCYNRWPEVSSRPMPSKAWARIRVHYRYFEARGYDVLAIKLSERWHPEPWRCGRTSASMQELQTIFPFWKP